MSQDSDPFWMIHLPPETGDNKHSQNPENGNKEGSQNLENGYKENSQTPENGYKEHIQTLENGYKELSQHTENGYKLDSQTSETGTIRCSRDSQHMKHPEDGYIKLNVGFINGHLQPIAPNTQDKTEINLDNGVQKIIERCKFPNLLYQQAANKSNVPLSKSLPMPLYLEGRSRDGKIEGPVRIFGKHVQDNESDCYNHVYPQLGFIGQYRYH